LVKEGGKSREKAVVRGSAKSGGQAGGGEKGVGEKPRALVPFQGPSRISSTKSWKKIPTKKKKKKKKPKIVGRNPSEGPGLARRGEREKRRGGKRQH